MIRDILDLGTYHLKWIQLEQSDEGCSTLLRMASTPVEEIHPEPSSSKRCLPVLQQRLRYARENWPLKFGPVECLLSGSVFEYDCNGSSIQTSLPEELHSSVNNTLEHEGFELSFLGCSLTAEIDALSRLLIKNQLSTAYLLSIQFTSVFLIKLDSSGQIHFSRHNNLGFQRLDSLISRLESLKAPSEELNRYKIESPLFLPVFNHFQCGLPLCQALQPYFEELINWLHPLLSPGETSIPLYLSDCALQIPNLNVYLGGMLNMQTCSLEETILADSNIENRELLGQNHGFYTAGICHATITDTSQF
jgi:hypothetical protein